MHLLSLILMAGFTFLISPLRGEWSEGSPQGMQYAQFNPPSGWRNADLQSKSKYIQTMVVGQGKHDLPPSLSLAIDRFPGSLKEYLRHIKGIAEANGGRWKDLGTIRTESGDAALIQEEIKTQWGELRNMYTIILKNGIVYLLTAGALKEEFPHYYPDFFRAMRSLKIVEQVPKKEEVKDLK